MGATSMHHTIISLHESSLGAAAFMVQEIQRIEETMKKSRQMPTSLTPAVMTPKLTTRQCLELLAAKSTIDSNARRSRLLHKTRATGSDVIAPVLDALASICAAKKGDVFAVSAEILHDQIVLTVAGNDGVPDSVTEHLRSVWRQLRKYKTVKKGDSAVKDTPQLDQAELSDEQVLCQSIYHFSMQRVFKRVRKYGEDTVDAFREWDENHSYRWEDFEETLKFLAGINSLFAMQADSSSFKLTDHVRLICRLLEDIYRKVHPVIESIQDSDAAALAYRPWKGIRRILSLHKDVKVLTRITRSPTRSKYLDKDLHIIYLEKKHIPSDVQVPDLYDLYFPAAGTSSDPDRKAGTNEAVSQWKAAASLQGNVHTETQTTVHAECVLLLEIRRLSPFSTCGYIGVSKPSCLACYHFFKTFNDVIFTYGEGFRTKGSNWKIYPRWGDPCNLPWTQEDESRKSVVQSHLSEALQDSSNLIVAGHIWGSADSTTGTEPSDGDAAQPKEHVTEAWDELEKLVSTAVGADEAKPPMTASIGRLKQIGMMLRSPLQICLNRTHV